MFKKSHILKFVVLFLLIIIPVIIIVYIASDTISKYKVSGDEATKEKMKNIISRIKNEGEKIKTDIETNIERIAEGIKAREIGKLDEIYAIFKQTEKKPEGKIKKLVLMDNKKEIKLPIIMSTFTKEKRDEIINAFLFSKEMQDFLYFAEEKSPEKAFSKGLEALRKIDNLRLNLQEIRNTGIKDRIMIPLGGIVNDIIFEKKRYRYIKKLNKVIKETKREEKKQASTEKWLKFVKKRVKKYSKNKSNFSYDNRNYKKKKNILIIYPIKNTGILISKLNIKNIINEFNKKVSVFIPDEFAVKISSEKEEIIFEKRKLEVGADAEVPPSRTWDENILVFNDNFDLLPVMQNYKIKIVSKKTAIEEKVVGRLFGIMFIGLLVIMVIGILWTFKTVFDQIKIAKMKSDFVSNVSHELKTPLAVMLLAGEKLSLGRIRSNQEAKEYYEMIVKEGHRLKRLIENVLDFSKMAEGKKKFTFQLCKVEEVIKDVINTIEEHANSLGFRIDFKSEKTPMVSIDKDAISQALLNLIDNAIKYSKDKKLIEINLRNEDKKIAIDVVDYGIGISENEIGYIFEKFYRAGDVLMKEAKGVGLGLAIVKYIMSAHNGDVRVKSESENGSTFTLVLPVKPR